MAYLQFSVNATYLQQGHIKYNLDAQISELVHQFEILVPTYLFTTIPQPILQLNVDVSTLNSTVPLASKDLSVYVDFTDSALQHHTPFLYNSVTPYSASSGTLNWGDTLALSGVDTTGLEVVPLKVNVYVAATEALEADFKLKLSLTRINVF